jgi:SAGA-associated factor 29
MAARSRPRGGQLKEEFDEERSLWNQIRSDARRIDQLMAQSDTIQKKILDLEADQNTRIARGDSPSSRIDNELEHNLRENIRLNNEIMGLIQPVDGGNDLCTQLNILSALRSSEDVPSSASRATSVGKSQRDRPGKRKVADSFDDRDSIAADSPGGPSPKVAISQKDRLVAKSAGSRAGSVPIGREGSVKAEDDDNGKGKKGRSSISKSSYRKGAAR